MKVVEIRQTIRKHTTKIIAPEREIFIAIPKRGILEGENGRRNN